MRKLILIKHAAPEVVPETPSEEWVLSAKGRELCVPLAEAIRPHAPAVVVTSTAPKASQTGEIVAQQLGVPSETAEGLHEHDRSNVPHLPSREFISMVELFFRRPRELVLGRETAKSAGDRFFDAIVRVLDHHPEGNVAVVSHGTVIALFAAMMSERNGFTLWRTMGLPSFAVFGVPGYELESVTERV